MGWFGGGGSEPRTVAPGVPRPDQVRQLALYETRSCGYCRRVRSAIERLGLQVEGRDLDTDGHADVLYAATGRTTVPCLFIDGAPLFESLDIIAWLEAYAAANPR